MTDRTGRFFASSMRPPRQCNSSFDTCTLTRFLVGCPARPLTRWAGSRARFCCQGEGCLSFIKLKAEWSDVWVRAVAECDKMVQIGSACVRYSGPCAKASGTGLSLDQRSLLKTSAGFACRRMRATSHSVTIFGPNGRRARPPTPCDRCTVCMVSRWWQSFVPWREYEVVQTVAGMKAAGHPSFPFQSYLPCLSPLHPPCAPI